MTILVWYPVYVLISTKIHHFKWEKKYTFFTTNNTLEANGEVGGSAGIIVALLLLSGGIVSIATRNGGKGGNIALIILYGLGALLGFALAGSYGDLKIWAGWCSVCAILAIVTLVKKPKDSNK